MSDHQSRTSKILLNPEILLMSKTVTGENNILKGRKQEREERKGKGKEKEKQLSQRHYLWQEKKKKQENTKEILEKKRYIAGVWALKQPLISPNISLHLKKF